MSSEDDVTDRGCDDSAPRPPGGSAPGEPLETAQPLADGTPEAGESAEPQAPNDSRSFWDRWIETEGRLGLIPSGFYRRGSVAATQVKIDDAPAPPAGGVAPPRTPRVASTVCRER
jgi:hypothetical protein